MNSHYSLTNFYPTQPEPFKCPPSTRTVPLTYLYANSNKHTFTSDLNTLNPKPNHPRTLNLPSPLLHRHRVDLHTETDAGRHLHWLLFWFRLHAAGRCGLSHQRLEKATAGNLCTRISLYILYMVRQHKRVHVHVVFVIDKSFNWFLKDVSYASMLHAFD